MDWDNIHTYGQFRISNKLNQCMSLECGKNRERTCKLHTEMSQSGFKPRTFLRKSIVLTTAPLFMSTFNKKQICSWVHLTFPRTLITCTDTQYSRTVPHSVHCKMYQLVYTTKYPIYIYPLNMLNVKYHQSTLETKRHPNSHGWADDLCGDFQLLKDWGPNSKQPNWDF